MKIHYLSELFVILTIWEKAPSGNRAIMIPQDGAQGQNCWPVLATFLKRSCQPSSLSGDFKQPQKTLYQNWFANMSLNTARRFQKVDTFIPSRTMIGRYFSCFDCKSPHYIFSRRDCNSVGFKSHCDTFLQGIFGRAVDLGALDSSLRTVCIGRLSSSIQATCTNHRRRWCLIMAVRSGESVVYRTKVLSAIIPKTTEVKKIKTTFLVLIRCPSFTCVEDHMEHTGHVYLHFKAQGKVAVLQHSR